MAFISYLFYRVSIGLMALVPFRLLYLKSNFLSFFLFRVLKYRRTVVEDNLLWCFPDLTPEERHEIAKNSYTNLSDLIFESFKAPSMSKSEMMVRYAVPNHEMIDNLAQKHGGVIIVGGHYTNWEWGGISTGYHFDTPLKALYKPLRNPYINRYINQARSTGGTTMVDIKETRNLFASASETPLIYVFVADQSPSNMREAIWLEFLGRDTACLHGPEKYGRKTEYPIVFFIPKRVSRGKYVAEMINLTDQIDYEHPGSITKSFMNTLEMYIRKKPEDWLWTHKRWKRRREEAQEQMEKISNLD